MEEVRFQFFKSMARSDAKPLVLVPVVPPNGSFGTSRAAISILETRHFVLLELLRPLTELPSSLKNARIVTL